MPQSFVVPITALAFSSGATHTNVISGIKDCRAIGVYSPALLAAVRVQVSMTSGISSMKDLLSGGATVTIAGNGCLVMTDVVWKFMSLFTSSAPTAAKSFTVSKRYET